MEVKVLVVDDEKDLVEALAERLETRGYKVSKAFNGDECIAGLRKETVDVVVLDILMPGKSGVDTLREIKQLNPLIEVIMLTGYATIDSAMEGLKLGAYDYVKKPADTADLISMILRAYARKSDQEERIRRAQVDTILAAKGL